MKERRRILTKQPRGTKFQHGVPGSVSSIPGNPCSMLRGKKKLIFMRWESDPVFILKLDVHYGFFLH